MHLAKKCSGDHLKNRKTLFPDFQLVYLYDEHAYAGGFDVDALPQNDSSERRGDIISN